MFTRAFAVGVFAAALTVVLGASDPADAAAKAAKAKKKQEPLYTAGIFKKLDANKDAKLDLDEFKKLFSVQPMPKGKKGAPAEPFDLEVVYKSLDANGDKTLSAEEFRGVVGAVFPPPKK